MPEITGRLRTPKGTNPPANPMRGEMFFDLSAQKPYYWTGTAWITTAQGPPGADGAPGPPGPPGTALGNVDGGEPDSVYGGVTIIDGGGI